VNINTDGDICVNILKDGWSPEWNLVAVAKALSILLADPNPGESSESNAIKNTESRTLFSQTIL